MLVFMGTYKEMKSAFQNEYKERSAIYKNRLSEWSQDPPIKRLEGPTNIPRARELGYKAKEGIDIVRVRVHGGSRKRKEHGGGRKPSKSGRYFTRAKSLQSIAEERVSKAYPNYEVLNSYFVGKAGSTEYYEVIMLNKQSKVLMSSPYYSAIMSQNGRAQRGLTRSGRKHRGIARKAYGTISMRPSKRSKIRSNPK
ncbi:MAG: 50S ribosomal protein L15e [Candidatus Micrarchaeia archaeon]